MKRQVGLICCLALGIASTGHAALSPQSGVAVSTDIIDFDEMDSPVQMVDQEFDPSILDNLATPTTAPAQVRLPPTVMQSGQWRGSQCGIVKSAHVVIRKPSDWDKFWTLAIRPYLTHPVDTPKVDFSKDMVVGVFLGEKPYPGAMIEIRSVKPSPRGDSVLEIKYKNTSQMQGVFVPPFPVQPFHLKKMPAFVGHVAFQEMGKPALTSQ